MVNQFLVNIVWLGLRYFHLKTKNDFSRRKLLKALSYSGSGAAYQTWKKGVMPSPKKLQIICDSINNLIASKELVNVKVSVDQLLHDSLSAIVVDNENNRLNDIISTLTTTTLTAEEKRTIALLRLCNSREELHDAATMLNVLTELLLLRAINHFSPNNLEVEFQTIKNILLEWIKPRLVV